MRPIVLHGETQGSHGPGRVAVGMRERARRTTEGEQMNHTGTTPESDVSNEGTKIASLANPRRTRLGADGRPIAGPVTTTAD